MDRREYIALIGTSAVAVSGCLGDEDDEGIPDEQVAVDVDVTDDGYEPRLIEIGTNEAVQWTNISTTHREVIPIEPDPVPSTPWEFEGIIRDVDSDEEDRITRHLFEESGYYWFYDDVQTRFRMCGVVVVDEDPEEVEGFTCMQLF